MKPFPDERTFSVGTAKGVILCLSLALVVSWLVGICFAVVRTST